MSWLPSRGRRRRMRRAAIVVAVLLALVGCGASAPSSTPSDHVGKPVGLIAIGHSGLTGHGTAGPPEAALQYSWATGTNPKVNSIYLRLVRVRPEAKGHVANTAIDGATASALDGEADVALRQVSAPALVIISTIGNDIRCDGTDKQHIPEFGQAVGAALDTITEKSPDSRILIVGQMGRPSPALVREVVARDPTAKYALTGSGICDLYNAAGELVPSQFKTLAAIIDAYEAEQARVCAQYRQCHTDGGARAAYKAKLENLAPDRRHFNIAGQTAEAAITWPVVEKILGL
jgi:hypothetical protein